MQYTANRITLVLGLACFGILAIGIALEVAFDLMLFEGFIGTFFGWGALLAIIYARTRCERPPVPGVCRQCGYDLRASVNRCPECGSIIWLPLADEGRDTSDREC